MSILAFIFVMGVVILVHELGHFVAGLLVHAKIEEFNIGMGPKVLSKKFKGIEYCLRALPLGGSVNFGSAYEEVPAGGEDCLLYTSGYRTFSSLWIPEKRRSQWQKPTGSTSRSSP